MPCSNDQALKIKGGNILIKQQVQKKENLQTTHWVRVDTYDTYI